jgi:hypothetical protein
MYRHFRIANVNWPRVLRDNHDVKNFNLCWISHDLGKKQNIQRLTLSHGLPAAYRAIARPVSKMRPLHVSPGSFWTMGVI